MKKLYLLFTVLFVFSIGNILAQPVATEEFAYTVGDLLTAHGYTAHSGGGTNPITVIAGNLTYPIYPSAGLGNMIRIINTGEDVNKNLAADITTGTVYASMLVNIDSARTLGDYFFHLGPNPISTTFRSRIFVKLALNGNLAFGLSVGSTTTVPPVYTDSVYSTATTYLVVVAYEIVSGTTNDIVKLWVNPSLAGPVPPALLTLTDAGQTDINIGSYAFRQGGAASGPFLKLDGLIIGTSWNYIVPVELTSFSSSVNGKNVTLNWTTATETNNSGFDVERKSANSNWQRIGFVNGNGTTTEKQSYSYADKNLSEGKYSYRLKQVDFNGTFEYSNVIEVLVATPNKFELSQNYPNPFNPTTSISFALPQAGNVKLSVYNLLGQEVQTLINSFMESGSHAVNFEATNLNSGIYLYKLEANGLTSVRKMTLLK
ncbi:MAG: T9SS type A sorting domain-containing protein [Ignavibacteria bacterium]|nr:T9SS type A sorting domain-containing protein [Ignavibacteria bacterium]